MPKVSLRWHHYAIIGVVAVAAVALVVWAGSKWNSVPVLSQTSNLIRRGSLS